jgi:hypothetical protein
VFENLAQKPAIQSIREITSLEFLDAQGSFMMAGIAKDSDEDYVVYAAATVEQSWHFKGLDLPSTKSVGAILPESSIRALLGQSSKLLQVLKDELTGEWSAGEIIDFEDGLISNEQQSLDGSTLSSLGSATGKINTICRLNRDWIMTGHETGHSMIVNQAPGTVPYAIAMCPKLNDQVMKIQRAGDKIVIVTSDGGVTWYDVAEILLLAETCKKTRVKPRIPTTSPSIPG